MSNKIKYEEKLSAMSEQGIGIRVNTNQSNENTGQDVKLDTGRCQGDDTGIPYERQDRKSSRILGWRHILWTYTQTTTFHGLANVTSTQPFIVRR